MYCVHEFGIHCRRDTKELGTDTSFKHWRLCCECSVYKVRRMRGTDGSTKLLLSRFDVD